MSRFSPARHLVALAAFASLSAGLLAACGGGDSPTTTTPSITPASLNTLSGDNQTGLAGSALSQSLVVRLSTASGTPVAGTTVTFSVTSGVATLNPTTSVTDAVGQASTQVTLGSSAGNVTVSATVQRTAATALIAAFTLTSTAPTSANCATPTTLAVGAAVVANGSAICIASGTAGAEFALIPFNGSTNAASRSTVVVTPTDITAATGALTTVASNGGGLTTLGASASVSSREAFELRLRASERATLSPKLSAARSWYTNRRSARLNVIPGNVTVGTIVTLNANADDACTNPALRAGRVAAVGSKALIVADTLNPAGGYTDADYAAIAESFDNVVDAVDTKNFGQPTDIDQNGHVILFFTSAVNALTPANANYYVGGFFYGRDLFPTTANALAEACASSNVAEMFYLMVPDPNGTINGNKFSKTFVTSAAIGTTAHEYQHLINASRKIYINTTATDFEVTWLDEGLAHVAEELVFYARAGLGPNRNLDAPTLRSNTTYRSAFNDEGIDNFGRLETFLEDPSSHSPYMNDDELETRGATWNFLRWAVDHQTAAHETVWQALVNSSATGLPNLRGVFGTDLTAQFRDWATSLILDDVAGATARYQSPSWNLRSILGTLSTSGTYPLGTRALANGSPATLTINGGGAAYLRFGVAAGGAGTLSWTSTGSAVQFTVVRLK